jgi:drug/metabolite transporter (DMT)-like permease
MSMLRGLKWLGTAAGILGALLVAANIPSSGWGFVLFLVSSLSWSAAGLLMREPSLVALNVTFVAINILGIVRWLL